ncbi:hypothetical protein SeLEV6574_g05866 [Synchytrium endobioticum]|uniref:Uncharacterized protein n=1 Tax=Synchytrium endobioticum TaxID=286115 RepID=A0A507CRY3_9FUNG|nr:hypothetical protein SeLEV6574_g05866 [Synchytrium endobioticum]
MLLDVASTVSVKKRRGFVPATEKASNFATSINANKRQSTMSFNMLTCPLLILLLLQPFHHIANGAPTDYTEATLDEYISKLIRHREELFASKKIASLEIKDYFNNLDKQPGENDYVEFIKKVAIPETVRSASNKEYDTMMKGPTNQMPPKYLEFLSEALVNYLGVADEMKLTADEELQAEILETASAFMNSFTLYLDQLGRFIYPRVFGVSDGFLTPWLSSPTGTTTVESDLGVGPIKNGLNSEIVRINKRREALNAQGSGAKPLIPSISAAMSLVRLGVEWCCRGSQPAGVRETLLSDPEILSLVHDLAAAKVHLLQDALKIYFDRQYLGAEQNSKHTVSLKATASKLYERFMNNSPYGMVSSTGRMKSREPAAGTVRGPSVAIAGMSSTHLSGRQSNGDFERRPSKHRGSTSNAGPVMGSSMHPISQSRGPETRIPRQPGSQSIRGHETWSSPSSDSAESTSTQSQSPSSSPRTTRQAGKVRSGGQSTGRPRTMAPPQRGSKSIGGIDCISPPSDSIEDNLPDECTPSKSHDCFYWFPWTKSSDAGVSIDGKSLGRPKTMAPPQRGSESIGNLETRSSPSSRLAGPQSSRYEESTSPRSHKCFYLCPGT